VIISGCALEENARAVLLGLIDIAISADSASADAGGFLSVMSRNKPHIRQDIPAAFEMYTLLSHHLLTLPLRLLPLEDACLALTPGIAFDAPSGRVVALLPVEARQLELVAYWLTDGLQSDTVRAMAGVLALPFSIEVHNEVQWLVPEWFAAFYIDMDSPGQRCVPILALRSVIQDERFSDWVVIARQRMRVFGLPCEETRPETQSNGRPTTAAPSPSRTGF
jgi:hypothetical protein